MATRTERATDEQARLAAALRENLHKRKQQARARAVPPTPSQLAPQSGDAATKTEDA